MAFEVSTICPNCWAQIEVDINAGTVQCPFCFARSEVMEVYEDEDDCVQVSLELRPDIPEDRS